MAFEQKEYLRRYYEANKERYRELEKARNIRYFQLCLEHYGLVCYCCKEDNPLFLTLGHPNNDGAEHRKSINGGDKRFTGSRFYKYLVDNNFPDDYEIQTECWNCNCGAARNNNICPHQNILCTITDTRITENLV